MHGVIGLNFYYMQKTDARTTRIHELEAQSAAQARAAVPGSYGTQGGDDCTPGPSGTQGGDDSTPAPSGTQGGDDGTPSPSGSQ